MRALRRTALAAAMLLAGACSSGTEDKSGVVGYQLTGPVAARAVTFRVAGTHTAITPGGSAFHVYPSAATGDTVVVTVVANQGQSLTGAIVNVAVPDKSVPPSLTVLQVADNSYVLKNASLYFLTPLTPAP